MSKTMRITRMQSGSTYRDRANATISANWLRHSKMRIRWNWHWEPTAVQVGIWQAVYSPVGADGYPKPIWDKATGKIDRSVAEYWREHYDLGHILRRDWAKLGPKLEGKIHIYVGEADNYFLNNAVYLVEDFLKTAKNPNYGGEVDYEPRAEHCWNGDHTRPNAI